MFSFSSKKQYNQPKVFVVGLGKTGTTTLEKVLTELGYTLGNQIKGEYLINEWGQRNFKGIIDLCLTADAFQDVPFCLPYTYVALDQHFPNAKFILTQRNSAQQWSDSLINFHAKMFGNGKTAPTAEELKNATYLYKGRPYDTNRLIYNTPENDLYNREYLVDYYDRHQKNVTEYFKHRPGKLLAINVSVQADYLRLCQFLDKKPVRDNFPWENKT